MLQLIFSFLLLLSGPLQAELPQVLDQRDFRGGINTTESSLAIKANQAQALANVYLDQKGITTRGGQVKRNATAIGGGSADVNNVFEYKRSDGTDYCVSFSSTTGYYSTDKCVSHTVFMSTLTAGEDVNCSAFQDRLYCVNGTNASFYFDGTNDHGISAIPVGKYIMTYQNRLWVAGASGNLSRLYYSDVGKGTEWDTTLQYVDFNPEDGDVISGIGPPIFEVLPVYKTYSSWVCQGTKAENYIPVIINKNIGAKYHRTIQNFLAQGNNIQLFDSLGPKGSQPGIYYFNGIVVQYASEKIETDLVLLPNFRGTSRYKQWSTQSEWNTGTLNWVDSTIDVNTITPSSWTVLDTLAADFAAGTKIQTSTSILSGSVVLDYATVADVLLDNFTDGNYTSNPVWTSVSGTWSAATNELVNTPGTESKIYTPSGVAYGAWRFKITAVPTGWTEISFRGTSNTKTSGSYLDYHAFHSEWITLYDGGEICHAVHTFTVGETVLITRTKDDVFTLYIDGVEKCSGTKSVGTTAAYFFLRANATTGNILGIDDIYIKQYSSTGTFISQKFNTHLSTPTGGPFTVSSSVPTGTSIFYDTRESSASIGGWGSWVPTTGTYRVAMSKQYQQYRGRFATTFSTVTPQLNDVTLVAASTGTWTAGETFLSADVSATWGLIQGEETTVGSAEWAYAMKSSTWAGGTAADSWHTVTNDAQISIATGAYIDVRATNSFFTSTDTAQLTSLTLYYNEGAQAESTTAEIYKGRYYWFGQSPGGSENDICYCLDSNLAWTYHTGIYARSAAIIGGGLYTGDSRTTSSGFIWEQDSGTNDDGEAFTAYWQGKDHLLAYDEIMKSPKDLYVTFKGESTAADLGIQLYGDSSVLDSWTVDISTSNAFGVKKCHIATTTGGKRAGYFNVKFTDSNIDVGVTVLGFRLYWHPVGFMRP